jgi:AcrR family transcriptional regulator
MTIDRAADSAAAERMRRAAIEAFAESGYGGSSTRQIAKRLNMSATAMYPHYRSKEELLYAIALEGHGSLLAALNKADDPARAHYRTIAPLRHQVTDVLTAIVAGGVTAGEFDVDNVDEVVMAISSLCVDVCRWFPSRKHRDARKLGEVYAGVAERLVR